MPSTDLWNLLGIVPQTPGIDLKRAVHAVYDYFRERIDSGGCRENAAAATEDRGDRIKVHDIIANYERGLSVDVIGLGNQFNDMKKELVVNESTRIEAKKDFYACGSVFLDIAKTAGHEPKLKRLWSMVRKMTTPFDSSLKSMGNQKLSIITAIVTIKKGESAGY
jgi:hypothetical protein